MIERQAINNASDQDIAEILTGSTLFLDMHPSERQQLLHFLVTEYFKPEPEEINHDQ